jgi:hypothetical protein
MRDEADTIIANYPSNPSQAEKFDHRPNILAACWDLHSMDNSYGVVCSRGYGE